MRQIDIGEIFSIARKSDGVVKGRVGSYKLQDVLAPAGDSSRLHMTMAARLRLGGIDVLRHYRTGSF